MYSKSKGITARDYSLTPPPGYDGSRFRRRSDGRDDSFPYYRDTAEYQPRPYYQSTDKEEHREDPVEAEAEAPWEPSDEENEDCLIPEKEDDCCPEKNDKATHKDHSGIMSFLQGLGSDDILLIALIVLLAGSGNHDDVDTLLLLALLLCIS